MSSYAQSYSAAHSRGPNQEKVSQEFREEYPTLATIFEGLPGDGNGSPAVSHATVNLFWEGGVMKFCVMPKVGNRIAFGTIREPEKGLAALEAEVCQGRFEWKISKSRK